MTLRFVIACFLCCTVCKAQQPTPGKINHYFAEVNGGSGFFTTPSFVSSKNAALSGNYKLSAPLCVGLYSGMNFNYSVSQKSFIGRFLSIGIGLDYMTYQAHHTFENYATGSKSSHIYHEFSQHGLSYRVNTFSPSVFFSSTVIFPGNFYVRNRFGLAFTTYLRKRSYTYTDHVTGTEFITYPSPYTQYYDWVTTVHEYNYDKLRYNAYYDLNLGTHYKNVVLYLSPGILFMDNELHAVFKLQAGALFFL